MKYPTCGTCLACEGLDECPVCGSTAEAHHEERREQARQERADDAAMSHYKSLSGA